MFTELPAKFSGGLREIVDPGLLLVSLMSLFNLAPLAGSSRLTDVAAEMAGRWELALVLGAWFTCSGGMYLFCKRRCGRLGAVIGGLLYVYSPHVLLSLPTARAGSSELLALALFPLLLWRVDFLRDRPTAVNFALVMLLQVALLNSDLAMAFTMTAIAVLWILVETLIQQFNREAGQMQSPPSLLALLALLLGMLAAATLWLPAAMRERSGPGSTALQVDFASWEALLSAPALDDAAAFDGRPALKSLGIAQWTFALIGLAAAAWLYIRGYRSRHPQTFLGTGIFAVAALGLVFLMLPDGRALWGAAGLPQSLVFPPRLHGAIAACLAIMGSVNGIWLERMPARFRLNLIALLTALPIATAIPLLKFVQSSPLREAADLIAGAPGPVTAPSAASDIAVLVAVVALALALLVCLNLRGRPLTERPYWTAPPLTRQAIIGTLLGAMLTALIMIIGW